MDSKAFHLGDILSITTDHLLSPRGMEGVYDILNFMTSDSLFTHQLPRAGRECKGPLLEQHPQLLAVDASSVNNENFQEWLAARCAEFGEKLLVKPLPKGVHATIDPIKELRDLKSGLS